VVVEWCFTGYEWSGSDKETNMRILCEDARHFWKKAPIQGTVFLNVKENELVYIRASDPVFNLGNLPNRRVFHPRGGNDDLLPVFVNVNLNRFRDDVTDTERDRHFVSDAEVDTLFEAGLLGGQAIGEPHARRWRPGHVWNYIANLHNFSVISGILSDKPTATELGHAITVDDFPVDLSSTMIIKTLSKNTLEASMWNDWFEPRAQVGGTDQVGVTTNISGIGEFAPGGLPVGDTLFELCRRVGNYGSFSQGISW